MPRIALIGIGQSFRGDDAAGIITVQRWLDEHPGTAGQPDLRVETAETPGIGLLDLISGAETAILVDAVNSGHPAGAIHQLTENNLKSFAENLGSGHGWGVAESLKLAHVLGRDDLPQNIHIIGIEGGQFDLGQNLSPAVEAQIPYVIGLIQSLIIELLEN